MEENYQEKVEVQNPVKKNNSGVYIILGIVFLVILAGAGYFMTKGSENKNSPEETIETARPQASGPASLKGQKFTDTNLFANAVLIAPGVPSEAAKAVASGWQIKSRSLSDGTAQVDLIPVGSEATEGDTAHTFNLKDGDQLYFVDINPNDDNSSSDVNKNDDMGILVGADGIVK